MAIMSEAEVQKAVMRGLISISDNYWGSFLEYRPENLVSEYWSDPSICIDSRYYTRNRL